MRAVHLLSFVLDASQVIFTRSTTSTSNIYSVLTQASSAHTLFDIAACKIDADDQRALVEAGAAQRLRDVGERFHLVNKFGDTLAALRGAQLAGKRHHASLHLCSFKQSHEPARAISFIT